MAETDPLTLLQKIIKLHLQQSRNKSAISKSKNVTIYKTNRKKTNAKVLPCKTKDIVVSWLILSLLQDEIHKGGYMFIWPCWVERNLHETVCRQMQIN